MIVVVGKDEIRAANVWYGLDAVEYSRLNIVRCRTNDGRTPEMYVGTNEKTFQGDKLEMISSRKW